MAPEAGNGDEENAFELQWAVEERVAGLEALLGRVCEACFQLEGVENAGMTVRIASAEEVARPQPHHARHRPRNGRAFLSRRGLPPRAHRGHGHGARAAAVRPFAGMAQPRRLRDLLSRAREQAREYGHSLARELGYLTAHSAFHLMGYDHETPKDRAAMRQMEERAMAMASLARTEEPPMTDQQLYDLTRDLVSQFLRALFRLQSGRLPALQRRARLSGLQH